MIDYDYEREFKPEFGIHGTSLTERLDAERGQAWAYYLNGGGGEPRYFDYLAYIRNVERER
jgi:hypothetical protein